MNNKVKWESPQVSWTAGVRRSELPWTGDSWSGSARTKGARLQEVRRHARTRFMKRLRISPSARWWNVSGLLAVGLDHMLFQIFLRHRHPALALDHFPHGYWSPPGLLKSRLEGLEPSRLLSSNGACLARVIISTDYNAPRAREASSTPGSPRSGHSREGHSSSRKSVALDIRE